MRECGVLALTACEIRELIVAGHVSATEVALACCERIDQLDPAINSFVEHDAARTMGIARSIEQRLRGGAHLPLAGVPYAIKDTTETANVTTTYGSGAFRNHRPHADAAVVQRLARAGGVFIGKTNTPEHAARSTTAFGLHGATRNPRAPNISAGGSSGGSAAAVAASLVPIAEGTDGGGSIRIPASCCGTVGMKPSRGRVSSAPLGAPRAGLVTHGVLTRTVRDAALGLDILAGPEPGDPAWLPAPLISYLATLQAPEAIRVGIFPRVDTQLDARVEQACVEAGDFLAAVGHHIERAEVDLRGLSSSYRLILESELGAVARPAEGFTDPYVEWCWERGQRIPASQYLQALEEVLSRGRQIVAEAGRYDLLLSPTLTALPGRVEEWQGDVEDVADIDLALTAFTYPFNITGQPAISLPLAESEDGVPIGVQLVAAPGRDEVVLAVAHQIELGRPWPKGLRADGASASR